MPVRRNPIPDIYGPEYDPTGDVMSLLQTDPPHLAKEQIHRNWERDVTSRGAILPETVHRQLMLPFQERI